MLVKIAPVGAIVCGLIMNVAVAAESCDELTAQLVFNDNGTVTDKSTGLTWSRCSVGQQWQGGACSGDSVRRSFADAQANLAAGYRLPTLSELLGVTAWDCGEPAVPETWSGIQPGFYWTSTEAFGGFQNTVLMTSGEEYPMKLEIEAFALLVK